MNKEHSDKDYEPPQSERPAAQLDPPATQSDVPSEQWDANAEQPEVTAAETDPAAEQDATGSEQPVPSQEEALPPAASEQASDTEDQGSIKGEDAPSEQSDAVAEQPDVAAAETDPAPEQDATGSEQPVPSQEEELSPAASEQASDAENQGSIEAGDSSSAQSDAVAEHPEVTAAETDPAAEEQDATGSEQPVPSQEEELPITASEQASGSENQGIVEGEDALSAQSDAFAEQPNVTAAETDPAPEQTTAAPEQTVPSQEEGLLSAASEHAPEAQIQGSMQGEGDANVSYAEVSYQGGCEDLDIGDSAPAKADAVFGLRTSNELSITTPTPGAAASTGGSARFTIGDTNIVIMPDTFTGTDSTSSDGRTNFNLSSQRINAKTRNGQVLSFTGPTPFKCVIQTKYRDKGAPAKTSLYGRGTVQHDKASGHTSLQFHESCHGQDYLDYLQNTPPPSFGGSVGMTSQEFQTEIATWSTAFQDYSSAMAAYSQQQTDCVGDKGPMC